MQWHRRGFAGVMPPPTARPSMANHPEARIAPAARHRNEGSEEQQEPQEPQEPQEHAGRRRLG